MTRPEIVETKTSLVEVENPIILMDDINVPEEPVEVRTVDQVEKKTGGKDKSKALLYSFFNNLGLSVQLESDPTLSNYLDYTISNSDDDSNRRIT